MTNESKPNTQRLPRRPTRRSSAGAEAHLRQQGAGSRGDCFACRRVLAGYGLWTRTGNIVLAQRTSDLAAPSVIAIAPTQGAPADSFELPGNVSAYTDSPIYARTSGTSQVVLRHRRAVKKGALLAEIATPELDQQLSQARRPGYRPATANNAAFRPTVTRTL